jgi:hypothetical protein
MSANNNRRDATPERENVDQPAKNLNIKDPKIESFHGKEEEDFRYWYDDFVNITDGTTMDVKRKIALFKRSLKSDARNLFEALNCGKMRTLKAIYEAMAKTLCARDEPEDWKAKLRSMRYQPEESLQIYNSRIKHAVKRAYPDVKGKLGVESIEVDWFIQGLPKEISQRIAIKKPKTIERAIEIAEGKLAKKKKDTRTKSPVRTTQITQLKSTSIDDNEASESDQPQEKKRKIQCDLNVLEEHVKQQVKSVAGQLTKQIIDVKKTLEEKLNSLNQQSYQQPHVQNQYQPQQQRYHQPQQFGTNLRPPYPRDSRFNQRFTQKLQPTSKQCYSCGKVGHLKRDCRSSNRVASGRDNSNSLN